jgi:hypothetical protein
MQQKKLDSFFKITINHNERNKKCFIYDPENYKAFFATKPLNTDTFIANKSGIKLYYRYMKPKDIKFPSFEGESHYGIPLLKSNLQKAVRRCDNQIAIQTSLAILQKEPMELLRRLPIIYIEDVCLMDSYSIPVWLMMADKDYTITTTDIDIILNIVNSLCNCKDYFDFRGNDNVYNFSHESLQDYENYNDLLSIYYRSEYGGMKGDIQMLKTSIDYYINNPSKIQKTLYDCIDYNKIDTQIEILVEAIDFHPFPQMLNILSRITKLDKQIIKECIWFVESGYNIRKPLTIESSKLYEERNDWRKIECHLDDVRSDIINM